MSNDHGSDGGANGSGEGLEIWRSILVEMKGMRSEMTGMRGDIQELKEGQMALVEAQLNTNARLESVEQVLRGHSVSLRQLKEGLDDANHRIDETNRGLGELKQGVDLLTVEVRDGFAELRQKIDSGVERERRLEKIRGSGGSGESH